MTLGKNLNLVTGLHIYPLTDYAYCQSTYMLSDPLYYFALAVFLFTGPDPHAFATNLPWEIVDITC